MIQRPEIWIIFFLAVAMLAGLIVILGTLPSFATPRATLLIELAKILASALVIGILGGYAKIVLERLQKQGPELEARASAKIALLEDLKLSAIKALRSLKDEKCNAGSFAIFLSNKGVDFEELLMRWESIQPNAAEEVRSSFHALEERFTKEGPTKAFRESATTEVKAWMKRFQ